MQNTKPTPEQFGWHNQNGFDDEPSGWMCEEGEERYFAALAAWEALQNKSLTANDIARLFIDGFGVAGRGGENTGATAESWLTQKIEAYARTKQREAWKEVNTACPGGYLTFSYIAARLEDTPEPCPGCMDPCGQCD